jgi:hypothetical protein
MKIRDYRFLLIFTVKIRSIVSNALLSESSFMDEAEDVFFKNSLLPNPSGIRRLKIQQDSGDAIGGNYLM